MENRRPAELATPIRSDILSERAPKLFADSLGTQTMGQLLNHFPRTYLDHSSPIPLSELPLDEEVTVIARVQSSNSRRMRTRKGMLLDVVIADDDDGRLGTMHLTFFNGYKAQRELPPGTRAAFTGKTGSYRGQLTLTNPRYSLLPDDSDAGALEVLKPIPVYPATEQLPSEMIAAQINELLDKLAHSQLNDPIPFDIAQRDKYVNITQAYEMIHRPHRVEDAYRAQHRFRYQEALVLQTALARRRAQARAEAATSRPPLSGGLLDQFDAALPFTLTAGQKAVGEQLAADLAAVHPMNRLLQGEVGSGKTLVALRAMLQVIDAGGQAALLAPTEVLAAQHYQSITRTLGPLAEGGMLGGAADGTRVVLLTGSMTTAQRRKAMLDAASGDAGIVIGTHALLSDNVTFFDLGLIVVDEQHRFGVEQRDALRAKASVTPHVLVMTATPIPRTVAMTVFGDLDVSTLTELPAGRAPIATHVVGLSENPRWIERVWSRAREEINAGRQVYVVCPKIGDAQNDTDAPDAIALYDGAPAQKQELTSVTELFNSLQEEHALEGISMDILHGRLDPADKADVMGRFNSNELSLLVSTTVIEVGVDVPNATLMIIMDADRFGISQLHQLRGRIGRGGHAGTCLLVTQLEPEHPSRERLIAVAGTTDGFELSQKDLELRREGNILGASQSGGRSALRFLKVIQHAGIIEKARKDAQELIEADPDLTEHPELEEALDLYLNEEKEAFLERG